MFNLKDPSTPLPAVSGHDEYWPLSHFWCHHLWPKLTKILPVIPISGWLAQWSLRYAQKCSKIRVKNSEQSFLPLHLATFLRNFWTGSKPCRDNNWSNKKLKDVGLFLVKKLSTFWFLHFPKQQCVKHDASGNRFLLSCCKCLFDWIGANLAHIKAKNLQNVQKSIFGKKFWVSIGSSSILVTPSGA